MPLSAICHSAIKARLERKHEDRKRAGAAWQGSRLLFTTRYGTEINAGEIVLSGQQSRRSAST
jgi:hypothetical protein